MTTPLVLLPERRTLAPTWSRPITFSFDGSGPDAFACHPTGHYEAGMRGTISVVG